MLRSVVSALLALLSVGVFAAPAGAADDPIKALAGAVELGLPRTVEVSWTDVVLEIPLTVRPVGVQGRVDRVVFTELNLNGIPFEIDPYTESFDLPDKTAQALPIPLRVRASFARVGPGALEEAILPSDSLHVTGRVEVSGTFRKWLFSAKRTVSAPIDVSRANPLAGYSPLRMALEQMRRVKGREWSLPF